MEKRALSAIPRPALTDEQKKMLLLVPHMSYLVTAERLKILGSDTLIMNFFHTENKDLVPAFRTFCQTEDYITQDLTTDKTKWKTGAINYLAGYLYWYKDGGNIVISSVSERETILNFLYDFKKKNSLGDYQRDYSQSGSVVDTEVEDRIDEYQDKIKEWKLQKKHEKEEKDIDMQMSVFKDIPDDYETFIKDTVFADENYMFYSSTKGSAYCTKCGHDFSLTKDKHLKHETIPIWNDRDTVKHNHTVACPYCGAFIQCKSEGIGRKNLFSVRWSVLVQKHCGDVLVRYFCHTKDFRESYRNPKIESWEKFRTIHTAEKAIDFEWARFKSTYKYRWCYFKDRSYGWIQPPEIAVPRVAVLYNTDMLETVSDTCMKYSAVDIYLEKIVDNSATLNKPWCIDWYFNQYRGTPYLEQLLKIGFFKIAKSVMEDHNCPEFENGKTVLDTLGVNKIQFNMLRKKGNPSVRDVMILRYAGKISQDEFDILSYTHDEFYDKMYERYLDMRQYTTIYKIKKYMDKQCIMHQKDYFDYTEWLQKMGYDMRNEFNLYPKDFKKSHDEKSVEYIKFKENQAKEDEKRFRRLLRKFRKDSSDIDAIHLKLAGMFIRLPDKLDELKREGETLHHCVGTYVDKVAKGETMIFFIRKESDPAKPYYTLEWKGSVIQCRGFKNCDMTPEVKAFVNLFQEKMVEYETEPKKHRKAG